MKYTLVLWSVICVAASLTWGCSDVNDSSEPQDRFTRLVWSDEFDVDGPVDPEKWVFDLGTGSQFGLTGWGNNELQYYTDRPENVRVEDEMLHITARREAFNGMSYTSGRILTRGLFETTFGRFEARIKLPFGQGIWPAFWLLGNDAGGTKIWPLNGEIDIMEYRGQQPTIVHGSIHGPGYAAGNAVTRSFRLPNGRFDTEFHIFAIEWGPDFIDFFVNDTKYFTITPADVRGNEWVFNDNAFHIILNVAVGGIFVGPTSPTTPFPQTMIVDYVRVYAE